MPVLQGKSSNPHIAEPNKVLLQVYKIHPLSQCWDSSFLCAHWPLTKLGPRGVVEVASWRQTHCQRYRGMTGEPAVTFALPRLSQDLFPFANIFPHISSQDQTLLLGTSSMKLLQGSIYQACPAFSFFQFSPRSRILPASYFCIFHSYIKEVESSMEGVEIHIGCIFDTTVHFRPGPGHTCSQLPSTLRPSGGTSMRMPGCLNT